MSVVVPAGPFVQIEGDSVTLSFAGQTIAGSFVVTAATESGTAVAEIAATNISASLGSGSTNFVTVSGGSGTLVLDASGLAGQIGGTVSVTVPGVTFTGTLSIGVNTTSSAISDTITGPGGTTTMLTLPKGPFLDVQGTGLTLGFAGQSLSGDLQITQTVSGGVKTVEVVLANGQFNLGGVATLSGLTGDLLLTPGGVAGSISISQTSLTLGQATLTGGLSLQVNSMSAPATLSDGTMLPAGPYLQVAGMGLNVSLGTSPTARPFTVRSRSASSPTPAANRPSSSASAAAASTSRAP